MIRDLYRWLWEDLGADEPSGATVITYGAACLVVALVILIFLGLVL